MADETDSYLDSLFVDFDEEKMQRVLDESLRRARLAEALLEAHSTWKGVRYGQQPEEQPPTSTSNGVSLSGRKSVFALIHNGPDDKEWTIPTVAEALGLDHSAHHAVGVSLSRLARSEEIARPRKGIYTKLSPVDGLQPEGERREMEDT